MPRAIRAGRRRIGDDFGAARSDTANGCDAGDGVAGVLGERKEYFLGELRLRLIFRSRFFSEAEAGAAAATAATAGATAAASDRSEVLWDGDAPNGARRAFLLHGEDVFLASDGDIVQRRYKVISIGANSIVVEDMANNNRQTLPLLAR